MKQVASQWKAAVLLVAIGWLPAEGSVAYNRVAFTPSATLDGPASESTILTYTCLCDSTSPDHVVLRVDGGASEAYDAAAFELYSCSVMWTCSGVFTSGDQSFNVTLPSTSFWVKRAYVDISLPVDESPFAGYQSWFNLNTEIPTTQPLVFEVTCFSGAAGGEGDYTFDATIPTGEFGAQVFYTIPSNAVGGYTSDACHCQLTSMVSGDSFYEDNWNVNPWYPHFEAVTGNVAVATGAMNTVVTGTVVGVTVTVNRPLLDGEHSVSFNISCTPNMDYWQPLEPTEPCSTRVTVSAGVSGTGSLLALHGSVALH